MFPLRGYEHVWHASSMMLPVELFMRSSTKRTFSPSNTPSDVVFQSIQNKLIDARVSVFGTLLRKLWTMHILPPNKFFTLSITHYCNAL